MTMNIMALQALIIVGCVIVVFAVWQVITRFFVDRYNMTPDPEHIIGNYDQLPGFLLPAVYIVLNFVLVMAAALVLVLIPILLGGIALELHDPLATLLSQPWSIDRDLGRRHPVLSAEMQRAVDLRHRRDHRRRRHDAAGDRAQRRSGDESLALVGAIYIMVRGLDNMDSGLPQELRALWIRWFPNRRERGAAAPSGAEQRRRSRVASAQSAPIKDNGVGTGSPRPGVHAAVDYSVRAGVAASYARTFGGGRHAGGAVAYPGVGRFGCALATSPSTFPRRAARAPAPGAAAVTVAVSASDAAHQLPRSGQFQEERLRHGDGADRRDQRHRADRARGRGTGAARGRLRDRPRQSRTGDRGGQILQRLQDRRFCRRRRRRRHPKSQGVAPGPVRRLRQALRGQGPEESVQLATGENARLALIRALGNAVQNLVGDAELTAALTGDKASRIARPSGAPAAAPAPAPAEVAAAAAPTGHAWATAHASTSRPVPHSCRCISRTAANTWCSRVAQAAYGALAMPQRPSLAGRRVTRRCR